MRLDPTIAAAIVAAAISLLVAFITAYVQVRTKINELTQAQFKDILSKRIEVYPTLWRIPQCMLSDWERMKKPATDSWARTFLDNLMQWHATNGAFLSQPSYLAFNQLRAVAVEIVAKCDNGQAPTAADLHGMNLIYYDGWSDSKGRRHLPLATCLKNDLGSYKVTALTVQ